MFRLFSFIASSIVVSIGVFSFFYYNSDFGWEIYYYDDLVFYLNIALVFLWIIKTQIRWQKSFMTSNMSGFKLTNSGWNKSLINELLPFFIYIPIAILLLIFVPDKKWISIILMIYFIEAISHLIFGLKNYKLSINKQSILILRNKQYILLWKNIKTIVFKHQGVIILEKGGRQKYLSEADFENFHEIKMTINSLAIEKNIYVES